MSLRTRFFVFLSGLGLVVLAAFSFGFYILGSRQIARDQAALTASTLTKVAGACREAALAANDISAINFLKILKNEPAIEQAGCLDASGVFRTHTDPAMIGEPLPAGLTALRDGLALLRYDEEFLRAEARRRLWTSIRDIVGLSLAVLATVVVGLSALLAGALAAPISELERAASEFGRGNFGYRTEVGERADEIGRLARGLADMARRLSELDGLKQRFFQQITHDLRAPLVSIQGYAEMIAGGLSGPVTDQQARQLQTVQSSSRRLAAYIDDILSLAKLEEGRLSPARQAVRVADVLHSVAEILQAGAAEDGVELRIECAPDLPVIQADEKLLHRAVTNLVDNALKFTPRGGRATVAASRGEVSGVRIRVTDTGPGIPPDKLEAVFDKFFQVTEAQEQSRRAGTGLGLTIAREIVLAHGGRLRAENAPGGGTAFVMTLPE